MKDQTSFYRFSQPYFVRKQNARRQTSRDFGRNVQLMRYEVDASADEPADFGFSLAVLMLQRRNAKIEQLWRVELARE